VDDTTSTSIAVDDFDGAIWCMEYRQSLQEGVLG
jgi:hypothetical protein